MPLMVLCSGAGRRESAFSLGAMSVSITEMARCDLYVFDLDGTLVDTLPDIARALNAALAERGAAPRTPLEVRGFLGHGGRDLCRRGLGGEPAPEIVEQVFDRYRAHYRDSLTAGSQVYPGIEAVLGRIGAPA